MNNMNKIDYELIIIGAGASGLFAGASLPKPLKGLILEKNSGPGKKLLMTGSGQCNLTRTGSIKDFITHYGQNGSKIRQVLYRFNNLAAMDFFENHGVSLLEREDGKVFPASLNAADIVSTLLNSCSSNGLKILYSSPVTDLAAVALTPNEYIYRIGCGGEKYTSKKLIIATGGCSYPITGSDGSFFSVLGRLGIEIVPTRPALVPLCVEKYPYTSLSGVSLPAKITVCGEKKVERTGDLLFTHNSFSGPVILNASRYVTPACELKINYYPVKAIEELMIKCVDAAKGNRKQISTLLYDVLNESEQIPKRLIDLLCHRSGIEPSQISSGLSKNALHAILTLLTDDHFRISGTKGYKSAMATAGGVSLGEVDSKTMESKKYPGMFFTGEVLDVDGDTGGYNLQFAFSSAHAATRDRGTPFPVTGGRSSCHSVY